MFKYLWIIILVIPILIFIFYTINTIRECLNEAIHCAELYEPTKDIKWVLIETWHYFEYDHVALCVFWGCLMLFGIVYLFAMSLYAYAG